MARKASSFSIVDDDDEDEFDIGSAVREAGLDTEDETDSPIGTTLELRTPAGKYDSSDESNALSPLKKLQDFPDSIISDLPGAGPSSGRKTVTKIRPPPQLIQISSESESDDSEMGVLKKGKSSVPGEYDPKTYEDLDVSDEIKELFQYITKYVPQHLTQDFKFKPFIPDYIPAVGDIDAFLKVVPPDIGINGEPSSVEQTDLGLVVLDEPAANQSDPAVLHLQLRAASVNVSHSTEMVIKRVDNLEKNSKTVDKWIKDISDLHRTKSSPVLKYSDPMPDLDDLMEEWPENMENLLKIHGFPSYNLRGPLSRYVDIVCCLFDIPVYKNKVQSLHLLFSLYAAVKTSHLYRATSNNNNAGGKTRGASNAGITEEGGTTDQLLLDY